MGSRSANKWLVVALGIASSGEKHVLGLWQGATENTTVVKSLLEDLVARGLQTDRRYLFVIDGAKALRAVIERVFGERAEVQRCPIHKRRNVKDHLPENSQKDYDRRIRNAYAMTHYQEARWSWRRSSGNWRRMNPSAAHSLEEGLEETLTVHRLGVRERLRRTLSSTNPIETASSLDGDGITGSREEIQSHRRLSGNRSVESPTEIRQRFNRRRFTENESIDYR